METPLQEERKRGESLFTTQGGTGPEGREGSRIRQSEDSRNTLLDHNVNRGADCSKDGK